MASGFIKKPTSLPLNQESKDLKKKKSFNFFKRFLTSKRSSPRLSESDETEESKVAKHQASRHLSLNPIAASSTVDMISSIPQIITPSDEQNDKLPINRMSKSAESLFASNLETKQQFKQQQHHLNDKNHHVPAKKSPVNPPPLEMAGDIALSDDEALGRKDDDGLPQSPDCLESENKNKNRKWPSFDSGHSRLSEDSSEDNLDEDLFNQKFTNSAKVKSIERDAKPPTLTFSLAMSNDDINLNEVTRHHPILEQPGARHRNQIKPRNRRPITYISQRLSPKPGNLELVQEESHYSSGISNGSTDSDPNLLNIKVDEHKNVRRSSAEACIGANTSSSSSIPLPPLTTTTITLKDETNNSSSPPKSVISNMKRNKNLFAPSLDEITQKRKTIASLPLSTTDQDVASLVTSGNNNGHNNGNNKLSNPNVNKLSNPNIIKTLNDNNNNNNNKTSDATEFKSVIGQIRRKSSFKNYDQPPSDNSEDEGRPRGGSFVANRNQVEKNVMPSMSTVELSGKSTPPVAPKNFESSKVAPAVMRKSRYISDALVNHLNNDKKDNTKKADDADDKMSEFKKVENKNEDSKKSDDKKDDVKKDNDKMDVDKKVDDKNSIKNVDDKDDIKKIDDKNDIKKIDDKNDIKKSDPHSKVTKIEGSKDDAIEKVNVKETLENKNEKGIKGNIFLNKDLFNKNDNNINSNINNGKKFSIDSAKNITNKDSSSKALSPISSTTTNPISMKKPSPITVLEKPDKSETRTEEDEDNDKMVVPSKSKFSELKPAEKNSNLQKKVDDVDKKEDKAEVTEKPIFKSGFKINQLSSKSFKYTSPEKVATENDKMNKKPTKGNSVDIPGISTTPVTTAPTTSSTTHIYKAKDKTEHSIITTTNKNVDNEAKGSQAATSATTTITTLHNAFISKRAHLGSRSFKATDPVSTTTTTTTSSNYSSTPPLTTNATTMSLLATSTTQSLTDSGISPGIVKKLPSFNQVHSNKQATNEKQDTMTVVTSSVQSNSSIPKKEFPGKQLLSSSTPAVTPPPEPFKSSLFPKTFKSNPNDQVSNNKPVIKLASFKDRQVNASLNNNTPSSSSTTTSSTTATITTKPTTATTSATLVVSSKDVNLNVSSLDRKGTPKNPDVQNKTFTSCLSVKDKFPQAAANNIKQSSNSINVIENNKNTAKPSPSSSSTTLTATENNKPNNNSATTNDNSHNNKNIFKINNSNQNITFNKNNNSPSGNVTNAAGSSGGAAGNGSGGGGSGGGSGSGGADNGKCGNNNNTGKTAFRVMGTSVKKDAAPSRNNFHSQNSQEWMNERREKSEIK